MLIVNTATGCGFTPQFAKIDVNGDNEASLYTFLKSQKGGVMGSKIKWNFTKFLVDRQGNVVARFAPTKTPEAIPVLVDGWTVEQIEEKCKGITCGRRPTSCADQLACAVREAYDASLKQVT